MKLLSLDESVLFIKSITVTLTVPQRQQNLVR